MTKEQNQMIFIGVGIIIFASVTISNLNRKKPKAVRSAAKSSSNLTVAADSPDQEKFIPADASALDQQKKQAGLPWGRNPFVSDLEQKEQILKLKLQGISFGKDNAGFAFINDQIVKKGDKLGDYEITEVLKDRVLIKKESQSFYLAFPEE
jgi:type II secretory pathway component PulC